MTLFPLLERELRTAARQATTYSVRLVGAAGTVAAFFFFAPNSGHPGYGAGLFSFLHQTILASIWIFVPFLTADCISRERREGTLPLLSLTPIRPAELASAKAAANMLRAFSLWLSALPVMAIPLLMGGVTANDLWLAATLHFSSLCLACGAGLLASSLSQAFSRALGLTLVLTVALFTLLTLLSSVVLVSLSSYLLFEMQTNWLLYIGFVLLTNARGAWRNLQGLPTANFSMYGPPLIAAVSALVLASLISLTGRILQRSWQTRPTPAWLARLEGWFCQPLLFQRLLTAWMRHVLDRNPVGWLQHRTWSSRLVMWSWLAVGMSVYVKVLSDYALFRNALPSVQSALGFLLAASLAMSAAGSFRRERETGVLELLLVSPLREGQLVAGRLRGLWLQFLPTVGLWSAAWIFCATVLDWHAEIGAALRAVGSGLITFATLPVTGLYFSLNRGGVVTAFVLTMLLGLVLPLSFSRLLPHPGTAAAVWQLGLATWLGIRLLRDLRTRNFRAQRTA